MLGVKVEATSFKIITCDVSSLTLCLSSTEFTALCPVILNFILMATLRVVNVSVASASSFANRKQAILLDARCSANYFAKTTFFSVRSRQGCCHWDSYVSSSIWECGA